MICFLLIYFAILAPGKSQVNYRVCTTVKHTDACEQIDRTDIIKCDISANNAGCLLRIENGESTFGTFTAEEAFLASELTDNLVVVGEFIREARIEQAEFETVVVVKSTVDAVNGPLKGLKGYKYCHPGFETTGLNSYILKEFEMKVLKANGVDNCDDGVETIAENYIKMLDGYFGPSCRPGKWVQDPEFDRTLKDKYPKLTQLCNISAYTANKNDPFLQSFDCLLSGQGDVALTTRAVVNQFMLHNDKDLNNYRYICREDYTTDMDKLCSWTRQPWQLLLAHEDVASNLNMDLRNWASESILNANMHSAGTAGTALNELERYKGNLMTILFPDIIGYKLNVTDSPLFDYMQEFRQSPTLDESKLCKMDLKWCTVSNKEQLKCRWFAQASLNHGIQPVINCVEKNDTFECIDAIHKKYADIITIEADLGFPAIRKNLFAIAFPMTKKDMAVHSLIVVNDNITRMENLRNKRGCFNQYGSMAWVSFINSARKVVLPKDSCEYGKLISDFVSNSCMPGARDAKFGISKHIDEDKLCSHCRSGMASSTAANCNAHTENMDYGNEGALMCLADQEGDFAVLAKSDKTATNFTVLCKNGTLAKYPGLNVDRNCYLSIATPSSIVTRRGDSINKDIELFLQEIDARFAREVHPSFKPFDDFYGHKDLLFKDSTFGLDLSNSNSTDIINYVNIFKQMDDCVPNGQSVPILSIFCLNICTLFPILIVRK